MKRHSSSVERQRCMLTALHDQLRRNATENDDDEPLCAVEYRWIASVILLCHGIAPTVALRGAAPVVNDATSLFKYPVSASLTLYLCANAAAFEAIQRTLLCTQTQFTRSDWLLVIALALHGLRFVLEQLDAPPCLVQQSSGTIVLTRLRCAAIVASAVFGLFATQSIHRTLRLQHPFTFFGWMTMRHQLRTQHEKFKCFCSYFSVLSRLARSSIPRLSDVEASGRVEALAAAPVMQELVSVTRCVGTGLTEDINTFALTPLLQTPQKDATELTVEQSCAAWCASEESLNHITIEIGKQIQDCDGCIQADFAAAALGGGILRTGCAQEEILFATFPELLATLLFVQPMQPNEALLIEGTERFVEHSGYSWEFRCLGPIAPDCRTGGGRFLTTPLDATKTKRATAIAAIDATHYTSKFHASLQYTPKHLMREIIKVYTVLRETLVYRESFKNQRLPFATGHWGCGVFNGDPLLKCLIQWIAASQARRDVIYCWYPLAVSISSEELTALRIAFPTVGRLFKALLSALQRSGSPPNASFWGALKKETASVCHSKLNSV